MIIDPQFEFVDVENDQWWNFRARGPLAPKPDRTLLVLHEERTPIAASLAGAELIPLPGAFTDARELASQLHAEYAPVDVVWVYDQANLDKYSLQCSTVTREMDVHEYRQYKIDQAAKLTSADFAVHPLKPFRLGYLSLSDAQRFLGEELPANAQLVLGVFEDKVFFSLVVRIVERRIRYLTSSDHFARQIAAAGFGPESGVLPFTPQATSLLEKLVKEEFSPTTISLFTTRHAYLDLFAATDRAAVLRIAEIRGDVWGTCALPNKYDSWQKMAGLLSYLVLEP